MIERSDVNSKFARQAWLRALGRTASIERDPDTTLPMLIERLAQERDAAAALISGGVSMSYRELAKRCNQYARWGAGQGLKSGDSVCLLMGNCPEYLCVWLGLTRIGVTVALANTQLSGAALAHVIGVAAPRLIIVDAALAPRLAEIRALLAGRAPIFVHGAKPREIPGDFAVLAQTLDSTSGAPLAADERTLVPLDATALYIYTSGTTGLPKAAKVSHFRVLQWSHWFAGLLDTGPDDRMYDCLPLYHSVGGVVATGATLLGGGAVVIRQRFSAADFWRDVCEERCTLFQYIGELCRYLVNSAPHPQETRHALRVACGNGLRADVWESFRSRFRIPRILEYYASTEGNFSLYNCEGEPGAIGRIPAFLSQRLPVALLRFDVERGEPVRNGTGFCERCAVNEVGEAVGRIPAAPAAAATPAGRFEGYADPDASARKVLHDVFEAGDAWYRTGDLMRRDERGFYYFVDRIGDTYRWKGENVSTAEVLAALTATPGVIDGVVYGVAVPGADGRAGLAALVIAADFDPAVLRRHAAQRLPSYARPVFLRLLDSLDTTGTFKPRKHELIAAGFDPAKIADPLYFDDPRAGAYVRLDRTLYEEIQSGAVRF